jgi:hypothetical protein
VLVDAVDARRVVDHVTGEPDKTKAADETNQHLREAGFPKTAITTWWMLLIDPNVKMTAHRVSESGDFATLR